MGSILKDDALDILKEYLSDNGINISFIARKMGIKPQQFYNRLNGHAKLDGDFIIKASKALNIKPDIFLKESYTV